MLSLSILPQFHPGPPCPPVGSIGGFVFICSFVNLQRLLPVQRCHQLQLTEQWLRDKGLPKWSLGHKVPPIIICHLHNGPPKVSSNSLDFIFMGVFCIRKFLHQKVFAAGNFQFIINFLRPVPLRCFRQVIILFTICNTKITIIFVINIIIFCVIMMTFISSDFPDTGLGLDYNYDDGFTLNGVCDSFCQVERNEDIVCENSEPWTEGARLRSCQQLIIFQTGGSSPSNRVWEECAWVWSPVRRWDNC